MTFQGQEEDASVSGAGRGGGDALQIMEIWISFTGSSSRWRRVCGVLTVAESACLGLARQTVPRINLQIDPQEAIC